VFLFLFSPSRFITLLPLLGLRHRGFAAPSARRLSLTLASNASSLTWTLHTAHGTQEAVGAHYFKHETRELGSLSRHTLTALEDIVGVDRHGERMEAAGVSDALRAQGRVWAQHVLEAPISWIASAVYIAGTVLSGYPGARVTHWVTLVRPSAESRHLKHVVKGYDQRQITFMGVDSEVVCLSVVLINPHERDLAL